MSCFLVIISSHQWSSISTHSKWLNYNYIFHMDKINMYIHTVQSLNNINWTLFEFQITHTRYRPCDIVILKMCTSYYGLIWRFFSYIFCMPNLVIFYHYMSWMVPSWCNLKLQQCSLLVQHTENVRKNLSNLPIIRGAHLQYVHKHCAKFK
jgi:hypothetical protein